MKKQLFSILLILALLAALLCAAQAEDAKEIIIDDAVNESVTYVIGQMRVTYSATGHVITRQVYSEKVTDIAYSEEPVETEAVSRLIQEAKDALYQYAFDQGYSVKEEYTIETSTGEKWDNRKIKVSGENDAVLIGDADYIQGAYGADMGSENLSTVQTVTGNYGIEHTFTVTLDITAEGPEPIADVQLKVEPPFIGQKRFSAKPAVIVPEGQGYQLDGAGWLERGGGMSSVAEDYTFEAGQTYYRTVYLKADENYAFKCGAPATGNYETQYQLSGECAVTGGEVYTTAIRGDYHSGPTMTVVVMVQPVEGKQYTVTVTSNNKYMGTASASVTSGFTGDQVTLTAEPDASYKLKEWRVVSGGVTVAENAFTIGTENVEIEAVFEDNTAALALGITPGGSFAIVSQLHGDVYSPLNGEQSSMNISCVNGDQLTFTATPDEGYAFKGWYEGVIGESYFVEDHTDKLLFADAEWRFTAEGYYTICAVFEKQSARLPGDVNGDGERNIMDVIRLLKYVSNWDVEIIKENADVTGDQAINIMDVIRLLKFVSGWKVELN